MRMLFSIIVCKILRFVGKLVGKGSSLPGKYALKLCPDILGRVTLPDCIIAVTGSNGKTSTVEMIAAILRESGRSVIYNAEGSNQIEGVTTLILSNSSLRGKVRGDVLLLESDERYARHSFRFFHPTHFVITNLYRDQLTRNGHPEWVYDAILPAIHPDTTLVLNADDPLVSCFAANHEKVKWFGVERCKTDTAVPVGVYDDGERCPACRGKMVYDYYHYHHIGVYRCKNCGHHRHSPDFSVTDLDLSAGRLTIGGRDLSLAFRSMYNVYNVLAAWSVCALAGVEEDTIAAVISNYVLKNGRMVTFALGQRPGVLLTSKHENSVAYDTNLGYIRDQNRDCSVVIMVDSISRKYFTGETSWLWDIDFDLLNCDAVRQVILCGKYVNDLALRFSFTALPSEKILCCDSAAQAVELLEQGSGMIYVVTCFSDREKLLNLVDREH